MTRCDDASGRNTPQCAHQLRPLRRTHKHRHPAHTTSLVSHTSGTRTNARVNRRTHFGAGGTSWSCSSGQGRSTTARWGRWCVERKEPCHRLGQHVSKANTRIHCRQHVDGLCECCRVDTPSLFEHHDMDATDSLSNGLLFFLSLSFTTKMLLVRAAWERMTQPFGYQSSESDQACGIDA